MEKIIFDEIDFYVENHNFISYNEYTSQLVEKGFSPEEIEFILKNAKEKIEEQERTKAKYLMDEIRLAGIFLLLVGVIITLVTFFKIWDLKGYFIFAFGPIFIGIGMIKYGRLIEQRKKRIRKFDRF